MKRIKTTENKLREDGWFNKRSEPGYFTKTIGSTRAIITSAEFKRLKSDEIGNFDVWWCDLPTPYEVNLLKYELKKLED